MFIFFQKNPQFSALNIIEASTRLMSHAKFNWNMRSFDSNPYTHSVLQTHLHTHTHTFIFTTYTHTHTRTRALKRTQLCKHTIFLTYLLTLTHTHICTILHFCTNRRIVWCNTHCYKLVSQFLWNNHFWKHFKFSILRFFLRLSFVRKLNLNFTLHNYFWKEGLLRKCSIATNKNKQNTNNRENK